MLASALEACAGVPLSMWLLGCQHIPLFWFLTAYSFVVFDWFCLFEIKCSPVQAGVAPSPMYIGEFEAQVSPSLRIINLQLHPNLRFRGPLSTHCLQETGNFASEKQSVVQSTIKEECVWDKDKALLHILHRGEEETQKLKLNSVWVAHTVWNSPKQIPDSL